MDIVWRRSRQDMWGKKSRFWASSSAKKVLLTAEKVEIGQKLAKISGGVKPGHLEEGEGPKMAKIHHGVKPDIFKYACSSRRCALHCTSRICAFHSTPKTAGRRQSGERWTRNPLE